MATLVLGTVGRIFGGPLGGLFGTALGGVVDRGLFGGGGKPREIGRIGNIAVQSSAYGEPIPFISGRMRAAGNLIWTAGIKESATRSGGGKRSGPSTTTYSYSASFAVGLVAGRIAGLGRIWADGKLIREAGGSFLSPVTMRLHDGGEGQDADPLIASFEGAGGTPAYRGLAHVVFEDLPLADYGNRIPNLTFEIIADADDGGIAAAIAALATVAGRPLAVIEGDFPAIEGHSSGRSGSVADAIAPLIEMAGAVVTGAAPLSIRGSGGDALAIPEADCHARLPGDERSRERRKRTGGATLASAVEIAFYDTTRDYQPGLQRARRDEAGAIDSQSLACAMTPLQAKTLATAMLARFRARRLRAMVRLPWRYLALGPGSLVRLEGDAGVWQVREARFESFIVFLDMERIETAATAPATVDGGRALAFDDQPAGATLLRVLDLPSLPGELSAGPRLWLAASGGSTGWRRAGIEASNDGGASYATVGLAEGGAVQGETLSRLAAGAVDCWDRFATVDVELLSVAMWIESRSRASVLAGSNIALIGNEIIQFSDVEALTPRRFRLSGLLRGRRGTEAAVAGHAAGERFVLLDPASLVAFDPTLDALGQSFRFRPAGGGDAATVPIGIIAAGAALRPLSPAHLRLRQVDGTVEATWIRRSRAGFGWLDLVDAPLAEATEAYRVEVALDGRAVRTAIVATPRFAYAAADLALDGGGSEITIHVAQLSEVVGSGAIESASLLLI